MSIVLVRCRARVRSRRGTIARALTLALTVKVLRSGEAVRTKQCWAARSVRPTCAACAAAELSFLVLQLEERECVCVRVCVCVRASDVSRIDTDFF